MREDAIEQVKKYVNQYVKIRGYKVRAEVREEVREKVCEEVHTEAREELLRNALIEVH